MFIGTVRDRSDAGDVNGLTYEAWDDLAVTRLHEIAEELVRVLAGAQGLDPAPHG